MSMFNTNEPRTPGGRMGDDMEKMFLDEAKQEHLAKEADDEATLVEVLGMIASGGGLLIGGIFLLGAILAGYAIWYLFIKK